ncbi:MAG: AlpA family phage regulatory protein [Synergistaceae bacterium]|nr:AlpA family phage regulatory protein [Synergistaceae bacterium]MBR0074281.1 AlpA family phage regulatory protein [Synergistaceae bacterium]
MKDFLLDIKEVSIKTNLTADAIYKRIRRGKFPQGQRIAGGRVWTEQEINDWLDENRAGEM